MLVLVFFVLINSLFGVFEGFAVCRSFESSFLRIVFFFHLLSLLQNVVFKELFTRLSVYDGESVKFEEKSVFDFFIKVFIKLGDAIRFGIHNLFGQLNIFLHQSVVKDCSLLQLWVRAKLNYIFEYLHHNSLHLGRSDEKKLANSG